MPTTEFSDDFNRANSDSLGSDWTELAGDSDIDTNQLEAISLGTFHNQGNQNAVLNTNATSEADSYAQADLIWASGTPNCAVMLRMDTSGANGYGVLFRTGTGDINIFRIVSSTWSLLYDSANTITFSSPDTLRVEIENTDASTTQIRAYVNGSLEYSFDDTNASRITTAGRGGLRSNTTGVNWDNYEQGILADGTTTSTTTSTSTSTSSSTSTTVAETTTSTTTTLASDGGLAFGEQTPLNGETAVSWSTWGGTGEVVGDPDWGKLGLDIGENGYSQVYDFGNENERTITITHNLYGTGQETATTEIRGQATSFLAADGTPTWEAYSTPVAKTWRFIQVRLVKS